ncbi:hypothetical protein U0070_013323 [Myodes glareolus]|uniref:Uncharacterized protein n=1 Tax=Myodes glareolus TaxID=447135 RepID=A0AAW0JRJ0_MYOGA
MNTDIKMENRKVKGYHVVKCESPEWLRKPAGWLPEANGKKTEVLFSFLYTKEYSPMINKVKEEGLNPPKPGDLRSEDEATGGNVPGPLNTPTNAS